METLVWLGAPFLLGAVLGALVGRSLLWMLALVVLGALLGFLVALYAYLSAPSQYNGCSDCGEYLGRWWEPVFVVFIVSVGYLSYLFGIGAGAVVRLLIPSRPARGSPRRGG